MNSDQERTFQGRIEILIESCGGPTELAKLSGLSRRVIDKYKSGESEPSRERLIALANAGGKSVEWLAIGNTSTITHERSTDTDFIKLPRYNARLAAGDGAFNERAELLDHIPFTKQFLSRKLGLMTARDLAILEVQGDSMEPTIGDGDLVIVDQSQRTIADGIMAFILDDTAYIKRMRRFFDGIEIISDNKELYPPIQLGRDRFEELHIIGRVRWCGHIL